MFSREEMVDQQLVARGITDEALLKSMRTVPRDLFVPEKRRAFAYRDGPLLIGEGQTISQPYIVARMCELAHCGPDSCVLDVGTGSGYAAAVLSLYVKSVYTIERIASLSKQAEALFQELGYRNIHSMVGDGTLGWPSHAPFDAIIVAAGASSVPHALKAQLKVGGRLVIPVGESGMQRLLCITRKEGERFEEKALEFVRFVPLLSNH